MKKSSLAFFTIAAGKRGFPGAVVIAVFLLFAANANAASPRINYMLNCMGCHLVDGAGAPGKVPPFKDHVGRFLRVPGGREFLVQVPGSAHSPLSDEDLAEVLNWILTSFSAAQLPVAFSAYTGKEVAGYRQTPLIDVLARREELLHSVESVEPEPSRTP